MCGRFALKTSTPELARMFGITLDASEPASTDPDAWNRLEGLEATLERYNIAPSQPILVCAHGRGGAPRLGTMRWGLVPGWAKDDRIGYRMINARAETAAERPAFRSALRRRRCLIPATGFYEWRQSEEPGSAGTRPRRSAKQPYYITLRSHAPFAFAGLWERWRPPTPRGDGDALLSCTILTTEPNALLAPIHDRMPVILPAEHYGAWLDPSVDDPAVLAPLLGPYDPAQMTAYPVGTLVNSPRNDDPRCLEPLGAPRRDPGEGAARA